MMERTLVLIKPDGLQRGLVGEVTRRLEQKGLKLVGNKMMRLSDTLLKEHYAHIADKPFFPGVKTFMMSAPVIAQCWEGVEAVETVRTIAGVTNARKAGAGTIRGDLAMSLQSNVVHASDSLETARVEVPRFFKKDELFEWDMTRIEHLYAEGEA
ncbi:nucleoside-diphosphate kinase [Patescibacteria group bacterium]|nr:nucleoside-diphosphate kinase [Patescibacteria group bacterium]MBU1016168.1 nucleoside-diphosphate kinase [Patescibacteria group bacterium]MBU1684716.1 nucleoside-diphosphate kinase [Patescibacteria group bacterium]MBU1938901.1 nucleoside-diphosphate kinase [Patescibacteria group bacterium]